MSIEVAAKAPPAPAMDGLPPERRRWAVAAMFTALAMASLDTAIANIALPAIAADLHVSPADVVWVVNVYQIALVATLLPLGALGEIVGHQRIYLGGLALFTLASLGCACAWSLDSLLVARTLQGLGASGIMSVNTALLRYIYPSRMLGRGFGHNALVVATAFTFGPTIASGILSVGHWPWLFAINIPFGLIAMAIGLQDLAVDAAGRARLRFSRRDPGRGRAGPVHHRDRRRRSSGLAATGDRRAYCRAGAGLVGDPPPGRPPCADAADRPVPYAGVRAVGR